MDVVIPDKMFFKIGEVAKITGIKPYILRYWETEFPHLRPTKGRSQHRLYRRKDVEEILRIKKLLYEEKFTIAGAKQALKGEGDAAPAHEPAPQRETGAAAVSAAASDALKQSMLDELRAIRELVSRL